MIIPNRRLTKVFVLSICVLFSVSGHVIAAQFDSNYFGAHVHRSVQNSLWKQVGFGSIRLHDANVTWADLQPQRDRWNWSKLDGIVENSTAAKVDILLPLNATPSWATSSPTNSDPYGMGSSALPLKLSDWDRYVESVAERYRGRIHAYEIWNEPNLKKFYTGSPQDLVELTRRASIVIRKIDRDAKIVCSSVTGSGGVAWLKLYLQAGAGNYCDVIGYHFYTNHQPPEKMLPTIAAVRSLMQDFKISEKPLWNTETGWLIALGGNVDAKAAGFSADAKVLSIFESSTYIARALVIGRYYGLDRFYWYSWDHPSMGISPGRGIAWSRPARVFSELMKLLIGADIKECKNQELIWNCQINLANGVTVDAMWSEGEAQLVKLQRGGELLKFAKFGELESAGQVSAGERIDVSQDMIFVRSFP